MTALLNNKFFVIFLAPFVLGALTILGFAPYNLTLINFFTFSILLFLIFKVKKKRNQNIEKKNLIGIFFIWDVLLVLVFF